jgi:hypothetical protein
VASVVRPSRVRSSGVSETSAEAAVTTSEGPKNTPAASVAAPPAARSATAGRMAFPT